MESDDNDPNQVKLYKMKIVNWIYENLSSS